ncbi:hypothetical protein MN116_003012 [Schistosoma mekongi]|uniref:TNase-like domain-containing protein n=1 Tax=Schistosoma mekongi TaxID=38744 RepID=A0AAE1ZI32_SCHME|nr:hypothetical protein MN116_003012 [Schistosoma mekongi]
MDKLQKFLDDNLKAMRLMPAAFLTIGAYLLAKHFYVFATFNSVYSIPPDVYSRQIRLKGLVRAINHTGDLEIFHVPKVRIPLQVPHNVMKLSIPIQHSELSMKWLKQNVHSGERIDFIPIKPFAEDAKLLAIVYKKWYFFRKDISYQMLVTGIANHDNVDDLPDNFHKKYSLAISEAVRKKRGIWHGDSKVWKYCKLFFKRIRQLINF